MFLAEQLVALVFQLQRWGGELVRGWPRRGNSTSPRVGRRRPAQRRLWRWSWRSRPHTRRRRSRWSWQVAFTWVGHFFLFLSPPSASTPRLRPPRNSPTTPPLPFHHHQYDHHQQHQHHHQPTNNKFAVLGSVGLCYFKTSPLQKNNTRVYVPPKPCLVAEKCPSSLSHSLTLVLPVSRCSERVQKNALV